MEEETGTPAAKRTRLNSEQGTSNTSQPTVLSIKGKKTYTYLVYIYITCLKHLFSKIHELCFA